MTKPYQLALHIFRRDLRLQDNTALIEALTSSQQVIPCFIFDKRQIEKNDYKSDHCIQFMMQSLLELDENLQKKGGKLYFFYGIAEEVVNELLIHLPIDAVFLNRDYTPFSRDRDEKIEKYCLANGRDFHAYADALLNEPEQVVKSNQQPYTLFTAAFNKACHFPIASPKRNTQSNYYNKKIALEDTHCIKKLLQKSNPNLLVKGGRKEGIELAKKIKYLADYETQRNFPAEQATTKLSAHNKLGTISIRELYTVIANDFGKHHTLIKELYWRDFFTHVAYFFPHVFHSAFHQQYNHLAWSQNEKHFRAWCEGLTGFPIVDAGMRELNTTGYMHNRVRMIVASFLTKDLHINWQWGEKYFAQKLVDYDAAVNNGNWQWAASTGCDAQPYFRVFNPWLQQEKFDADCLYIKKWVPELAKFSPNEIHKLGVNKPIFTNYPLPIVNHAEESGKAKILYKKLNK